MSTELERVRRAANRAAKDQAELQEAIRAAKTAGATVRAIAAAAGIGVATTHRILKETQS